MEASRRRKVLAVGAVSALAAFALLRPEDGRPAATGVRARPLDLTAGGVAAGFGVDDSLMVRSPPPIDVEAIERGAERLPFADVPLPDDRLVQSWTRRDTGQVVTQAVLVYDDPADAEDLNRLAERLLPMAFSLSASPATIPGAEGARGWSAPGYYGVSFRREGYIVFVGADGSDVTAVHQMASRIAAAPLPTRAPPTSTPPSGG